MLSRLELIPRSRFPAFSTGSVAEQASIAAQHHANACSPSHARSIILRTTQPPVGLVIVVLLPKTWQISESLSGDNEAISVAGFRVPQHQKRVLVKNLPR
jgi:hypothetical protein